MPTKSTSFRLSTTTYALLKQLSEKENRSLTNMVETLIMDRSKGDSKMNAYYTAVVSMTLDSFTDLEISAMMNALSGFGRIDKENLSYKTALDRGLIDESGAPTFDLEYILAALDHQARTRPAFGLTGP